MAITSYKLYKNQERSRRIKNTVSGEIKILKLVYTFYNLYIYANIKLKRSVISLIVQQHLCMQFMYDIHISVPLCDENCPYKCKIKQEKMPCFFNFIPSRGHIKELKYKYKKIYYFITHQMLTSSVMVAFVALLHGIIYRCLCCFLELYL